MRSYSTATAAALLLIGFAPAGCGPSEAQIDAANADRVAEMTAQADRDLKETLAVLADTEQVMRPRVPAPDLIYDAFRGETVDPDADTAATAEQTADVETD